MASVEKPLGLKPEANGDQGPEAGDQHGDLEAQRRHLWFGLSKSHGKARGQVNLNAVLR